MAEDVVLLDTTREGVAVVTLNRPELHNAFNASVIEDLSDAFADLAKQDGVRVVILEGKGKCFSAGADIEWMRAAGSYTLAENREDAQAFAVMLHRLRVLPQASVAVVHGPAIAGGTGLVAACDIAIATPKAMFGLTEVRLGLIPAVVSPYVIEAIGPRAARRYFLTGEKFGPDEAYRLGLVHSVVPDMDALAAETERIVSALLEGAPGAIRDSKRLLDRVAPLTDELRNETARAIAERRASAEGKEGLLAFLEKRKPKWAQ